MGKRVLGVVVGLIVWFAVTAAAGVLLRALWPDYVAASGDLSFTLPMKLTRLSIGAVATLVAGAVTAGLARSSGTVVVTGALLLLFFIPEHISLWDKFPIWYHLTFLTSLVPLTVVGGKIPISAALPVRGYRSPTATR